MGRKLGCSSPWPTGAVSFAICPEMLSFRFHAIAINYLNFKFGKPTFPASHPTSSLLSLPAFPRLGPYISKSVPFCSIDFSHSGMRAISFSIYGNPTYFPRPSSLAAPSLTRLNYLLCSIKSFPSPYTWLVQFCCTFILRSQSINYWSSPLESNFVWGTGLQSFHPVQLQNFAKGVGKLRP